MHMNFLLLFLLFGAVIRRPIFLGEYMRLIALVLFGFIVIYSLVIVTLAFADDFFRKNGSR
ncbi:hypothetical protein B6440_00010 [Salmonella enterica]|nr:hypothetical protein [Salmonella enterica]